MNKRAALALFITAAATPALAQFGGRRRERPSTEKDSGGEPRVNTLEVTVQELHEDLKLTAEQEPLWQAYVDTVLASATRPSSAATSLSPAPGKRSRMRCASSAMVLEIGAGLSSL